MFKIFNSYTLTEQLTRGVVGNIVDKTNTKKIVWIKYVYYSDFDQLAKKKTQTKPSNLQKLYNQKCSKN